MSSEVCENCGSGNIKVVYENRRKPRDGESAVSYTISAAHPTKPEVIGQCGNCGLRFVLREHGRYDSILKDYEEYIDEDYTKEEKGRRRSARVLLDRIAVFSKPGRMLEVGCANGFFLDEARKRGWEVGGIEPSQWAKKYAEERMRINILAPTLGQIAVENETFDVVVLLDVIEHFENPKKMLEIIKKILKKNGILVITTPDVDSFLSRLLGAKWWGINRHHLFYFSKKTIQDMLKRTGFEVLCCKGHIRIFTCDYWIRRISAYMPFLIVLLRPLFWIRGFGKQNLRINLYDQIELYAKKAEYK